MSCFMTQILLLYSMSLMITFLSVMESKDMSRNKVEGKFFSSYNCKQSESGFTKRLEIYIC